MSHALALRHNQLALILDAQLLTIVALAAGGLYPPLNDCISKQPQGAGVRVLLFVVLVLASASAAGTDAFDQRVAIAKKLEDAPQGQAYNRVLYGAIGDYMQKTMVQCFPPGVKADTEHFTLVADILVNGTAARVQVRPDTKMAACFGKLFQVAPFPALPVYAGADGLPIFITIRITP